VSVEKREYASMELLKYSFSSTEDNSLKSRYTTFSPKIVVVFHEFKFYISSYKNCERQKKIVLLGMALVLPLCSAGTGSSIYGKHVSVADCIICYVVSILLALNNNSHLAVTLLK
jgi:hypothetical protein